MKRLRAYLALGMMLIFCCYYAGISLFSHTHIVHGSCIVHSHLGGGNDHDHSDSQYAVIDILSNFQSEYVVVFHNACTPFLLLSESLTGYDAPSYTDEVHTVHGLRGPPQA